MASDPANLPEGGGLQISHSPSVTRIVVSGLFGRDAVSRIDDVLAGLSGSDTAPVLLRIASREVEFGAGDALRQTLTRCRRIGRPSVAVWADEPLIRRWIPLALLHRTPPYGGVSWDTVVPAPP